MPGVDLDNPATYAGALLYEHTDIPPGLTIAEWRHQRAEQAQRQHAAARAARRQRIKKTLTLPPRRRRTPRRLRPQVTP